ncbi:MAG TPA: hypothetical protein VGI60_07055 [Chthoniobacterales bacterium]
MPSTTNFALLLPKTPQEVRELDPENRLALAEQCEVKADSDSLRQSLCLERERSEELPADAAQYVYLGNFH